MATAEPSGLAPLSRLGPYEVTARIGAGGMGEVYKARDTRLERDVALKLLPPQLASDPQFRARFEREAKSVSALNHPHICTLHDLGSDTVKGEQLHYLILELIEGESLAQRLGKGPLPVEDVLRYGVQIASALDAAHRRGIVHRDLKPGNVMITKTGAKLLDFGLARSTEGKAVVESISTLNTAHQDQPLTEAGTIVGTFQYMAPEQLEAQTADARTDIFALGALLYEMATGKKAFEGKTRTSLIAAIISSQPPEISSVQAMIPPALDHVVRKCLEKDPDDRWQSARDVMAELQWISEGGSRAGLPGVVSTRRRVRERTAWIACAVATLAAIGFAVAWARRAPQPAPVVRFQIPNPEGITDIGPPFISPDGRVIAFSATDATGKPQIWVRPLDALEARPLAGTEGALRVIWSPDSRSFAFVSGGKLRRIAVAGGPPQVIADAPFGSDGTWNASGVILFDGRSNDPLWRVEAAGGVPKTAVPAEPEKGIMGAGWPAFLPDGKHFLYQTTTANPDDATVMVRALDGGEAKVLLKTPSQVVFASPGHLLFVRDRTLVAQPFDPSRQEMRGEPVPLSEGLGLDNVGLASISASANGVLAFRGGQAAQRRIVWMDRNGKETPALDEEREYVDMWLSPDGRRLVFGAEDVGGKGDLWIRDFERGTTTRFTFEAERDFAPVWSPDGRRIAFSTQRKAWDLFVKDAAGTGEPVLLLATDEDKFMNDWSRDGTHLVFASRGVETTWDLWALKVGDEKPLALRKTKFVELNASISPDGRFLAYQSNESGRMEVYVQEFPEARSKWQVSPDGGREPFWKGDGRELYYRAPDAKLMAVPIEKAAAFTVGTPVPLFQGRFAPGVNARSLYRPTPDGQRFLILSPRGRESIQPATVVLNWTSALP